MIAIHLRTYPEGTALWSVYIGVGAKWYSEELGLSQPALIPSNYAGAIEWLVIAAENEAGTVIAEKVFKTATLEDGIIYGMYWDSLSPVKEGSVLEEERREVLQLLVTAAILGMIGMSMLRAVKG